VSPTASPYWARTATSTASPGWAAPHPSAAPRPWSIASAWVWVLGLPPPQPDVIGGVPTSGATGVVVTVNGKFLLGATGVSFNGTPATTSSNISATVPPGATTGPITVTTPNGSSTSAGSFTVQ